MNGKILYIQLADDEWGNELMQLVASDALTACPDIDAVQVREHGGWYLTYARSEFGSDPASLLVVGTANDAAVMTDRAVAFWERFPTVENHGHINRNHLKQVRKEMVA